MTDLKIRLTNNLLAVINELDEFSLAILGSNEIDEKDAIDLAFKVESIVSQIELLKGEIK